MEIFARSLTWALMGIIVLLTELHFTVSNDIYGCHDMEREIQEKYGEKAKKYYWYPRCLPGGYYQNVQCDFQGCFCSYVDTGLRIPNTYSNVRVQYMKENCPYLATKMPDACTLPQIEFPCKEISKRYYFNPASGECEAIGISCLGFETMEACSQACVVKKRDRCNFRVNPGKTCDTRKPGERWYHDDEEGICRPFYYKGCGGNSNNYKEKWMCLKTCSRIHTTELIVQVEKTKYIIGLPTWLVVKNLYVPSAPNVLTHKEFKEIESYMTEITRYPAEDEEREGELDKELEQFRPEHAPKNMTWEQICSQEKQPGPCRAHIPRWHFNKEHSKCVAFSYGGCLGNANRHLTAQGCAAYCRAEVEPSLRDKLDDIMNTGGKGPFGSLVPPKPDKDGKLDGSRTLETGPSVPPGVPTAETTTTTEETKPTVVESGEESMIDFILE